MNSAEFFEQMDNAVVMVILILALCCYTLLIELTLFRRCSREWYLRVRFWSNSVRAMISALPLIGLLGTIVGLLDAFDAMALGREYDHQQLVSRGIVDAMFTDAELDACAGWGHLSWRQAVELADAAGVKQLVLFHHHPLHDDAFMDAIAREAGQMRDGVIAARENLTLEV